MAIHGDNFQFNNTTTITFKVAAGATVTVHGYSGYSYYTLTGSNATDTTQDKTVYYSSETTVVVTSTGGGYFYYISITF